MNYADLISELATENNNVPLYGDMLLEQLLLEANIKNLYAKFYAKDMTFGEFNIIVNLDPTTVQGYNNRFTDEYQKIGDYVKWMIVQFRKSNSGIFFEDLFKYKKCLKAFDQEKKSNRLPADKRDINRFKSLNDLYDLVEPFIEKSPEERDADEIGKTQVKTVYSDAEWDIKVPLTYAASCLLGKHTRWCTATPDYPNMYERYTKQGPLYVLIRKSDGLRYQFHFESEQFMDVNDRRITLEQFLEKTPAVLQFFVSVGKVRLVKPIDEIKFKNASIVTCQNSTKATFLDINGKLIWLSRVDEWDGKEVKLLITNNPTLNFPEAIVVNVGKECVIGIGMLNKFKKYQPDVYNYLTGILPIAQPVKTIRFKKCSLMFLKSSLNFPAPIYKLLLKNGEFIVLHCTTSNVGVKYSFVILDDNNNVYTGEITGGADSSYGKTFIFGIGTEGLPDMDTHSDLFSYLIRNKYYSLTFSDITVKQSTGPATLLSKYYFAVDDWNELVDLTPGADNVKYVFEDDINYDYRLPYEEEMYDILDEKNKVLIQRYIAEHVEQVDEDEGIGSEIGTNSELLDIKRLLANVYSDMHQNASIDEAQEKVKKELISYWGIGYKWVTQKKVEGKSQGQKLVIYGIERNLLFAACEYTSIHGDESLKYALSEYKQFNYREPSYGYSGHVDNKDYNDMVRDRWHDEFSEITPEVKKEQMVLPASNSIFTEIQNSLIKGYSGKYIEEND